MFEGRRKLWAVAGGVAVVLALLLMAIIAADGGNPTVIAPAVEPNSTASSAPSDSPSTTPGADEYEGSGAVAASLAGGFPFVTSKDLNDHEVTLPAALPGEMTAVLLSWGRSHQDPVDDWIIRLRVLEAEYETLDHVQLAISADGGAMMRNTATFFMTQAIEDPADRARTIPLFTDVEAFADLLGATTDEVTLLLVTPEGEIVWGHAGAPSEAAENQLVEQLG